ncbi:hypothetical protein [Dokdonia donghaensis]|uniref:hypothetical protein n=1 Tax=Dokdonia donghaensis TaxID=326320 RepID=UPI0007DD4312|nr:hypothetical protein [Dokdonia donghaensis]ANH59649.1 hypothetical protein I597_0720 [Dokdonia donghaensis DSW-1]
MKIYGECSSCHKHLLIHTDNHTAFETKLKTSVRKNCARCGVTNTFTLHNIKVKSPKRVSSAIVKVAITGCLMLVASYLLLENLTEVALVAIIYTIPALLYILYTRKNFDRIQAFNSNKA